MKDFLAILVLLGILYYWFKDSIIRTIESHHNEEPKDSISTDNSKKNTIKSHFDKPIADNSIYMSLLFDDEYKQKMNDKYNKKELIEFRDKKSIYMKSNSWNQLRIDRLDLDNYTCQLCNRNGISLSVHHITYTRVYNEKLDDLRSLCSYCHTKIHNELGYPKNIYDYKTKYYWKD